MEDVGSKNDFKKRLYMWTLNLIKVIDSLPKTTTANVVGKQLLRSGTSVLANYIEARAASSRKDYINFFTYSLKSANESKMWIALLRDAKKGDSKKLDPLLSELTELANIIASSIITMKKK